MSSESHLGAQSVSLATVKGEFVLKSWEAAKMAELLEKNLEGLRQRSVYALAHQDVSKPGKSLQHASLWTREHNLTYLTHGSLYLSLLLQMTPCSWFVNVGTCCM